jgi:hypothetical protein
VARIVTPWNAWREAPRAPHAQHVSLEALDPVRCARAKNPHQERREREVYQRDQVLRSGFVGKDAELANTVRIYLLSRGFHWSVATIGAQLCATGGDYNFQGNRRLATLTAWCLRTIQRGRKALEEAGLLISYLLEPGDMVAGQNAPVARVQIARNVAVLVRKARLFAQRYRQGLNRKHAAEEEPTTAAHVPGADSRPMTAEGFAALAARIMPDNPELAALLQSNADAMSKGKRKLKRKELPVVPFVGWGTPLEKAPAPEEIDAWERDTAQLEEWIQYSDSAARGPPKPRDSN